MAKMPQKSRYAGQDIDVSSRHSIRVLSGNDKASPIEDDDSHIFVDNFYHQGTFWKATIPLHGVE